MKRIIISAAIAVSAAAAHADPVTVMAPTAGASTAEVASYLAKLDKAVNKVCWEAYEPLIGFGLYGYQACLKETRVEVAKSDPTGLYTAVESKIGAAVLAAR